jgi:hypothetical protein
MHQKELYEIVEKQKGKKGVRSSGQTELNLFTFSIEQSGRKVERRLDGSFGLCRPELEVIRIVKFRQQIGKFIPETFGDQNVFELSLRVKNFLLRVFVQLSTL